MTQASRKGFIHRTKEKREELCRVNNQHAVENFELPWFERVIM